LPPLPNPPKNSTVGIELRILSSKISLPWNLHLELTAGNRHQQVTSVVKRNYWYFKLWYALE